MRIQAGRRSSYLSVGIKDPSAEVTVVGNERSRTPLGVSAANIATARRLVHAYQANAAQRVRVSAWRKDPAAEIMVAGGAEIRHPLGTVAANASTATRRNSALRTHVLLQQRRVVAKDTPVVAAEKANLQVRQTSNVVAQNRPRLIQATTAGLANRLNQQRRAWRKDPASEVTAEAKLRVKQPYNLVAQNRKILAQRNSEFLAAYRAAARLKWLLREPVAFGEIWLTLPPRSLALSVVERTSLTVHDRSLALTLPDR